MTDATEAPTSLYGEPFDSGLAEAHGHHMAAEFGAAYAVYEELLDRAGSLDDSPDVRFLRAHLLSDLTSVLLSASDLPRAEEANERARALLDGVAAEPMGPQGRQLWLEMLLRTLIAGSAVLSATGRLDEALARLDEAAAVLPGFRDPEGLRAAEIGLDRVLLLMARGEWGAAEEHAVLLLSVTPDSAAETIPRLLTALGAICSATGRYDPAEDHFARAEDGFLALGDSGERQGLLTHRAFLVWGRGELGRAEELFTEASTVFEGQRRFGDLAVCEQARSHLAGLRGDATGARDLMAASLDRFTRLGASVAAADSMLLGAQHAYARGDVEEMKRLSQEARDVYQARRIHERCAQVDLLLARALEDDLDRADHGDHERRSVDTALSLALPAALTLAAARHDFVTAHARGQWLELADEAMRLVFRLAVRRQDQGLLFELVEHRCAGAALSLGGRSGAARSSGAPVFPDPAMKTYGEGGAVALGGVAAEAAASAGLRVGPPPKVRMSAESGRVALQEYIAAAEFRYGRRIVAEVEVPFWDTEALTGRPVVQVRLADAGDLFMTWTWAGGVRGFGTGYAPAREVERVVGELSAALPGSGEGEAGMRRAFGAGAFAGRGAERRLARALGGVLWPEGLTEQIRRVAARTGRPLVRIQPSPRTAQVPWELLAVDDTDVRLLDLADVVTTAPTSLRRRSAVAGTAGGGGLAAAVGPPAADGVSGPPARDAVSGPPAADGARGDTGVPEPGGDQATAGRPAPGADRTAVGRRTAIGRPAPAPGQVAAGPPAEAPGPVVLVLDPRVPGFRADSPLGSVLGPPGSDPELLALVRRHLDTGPVVPSPATPAEAFRRTDLDREWLSGVLRAGPRRLLYVGHVSGAPVEGGQSEDGTLHLCCGPGTAGLTEPVRAHRPLSAKDLLLGTLPLRGDGEPGAAVWPAPPRVALIGCESGGDLRFAESFGLATAMLHNGADLVTATRWPLPTSFAFHHLAGVPESVRPLSEAVVAVDTAHEDPDPVHGLCAWQRERLDRWRADGRIADSPLLWAALTCIVV
ncbi:CHAT domain-containing protein [Streptomyces sp. NPDC059247]|uniref:CHAT domain-containing protein n=1 Tax=Streptomyces sp. NPDC059247 TaxID=3346790 RepID=UPI0036A9D958